MTIEEKRRETRSELNPGDHHNLFFLEKGDASHPISKVRDVSISGVGIITDAPAEASEKVALTYDSDDFRLTINGVAAWCSANDDGTGYAMGIEFDASDPADNSLFFMAVRKYLDDFDNIPVPMAEA